MSKNQLMGLFNNEPAVQPNEVKLNAAQEWLLYLTVGLFVPFLWLCNNCSWGGLALLIAVPSWVFAAVVAGYYQRLSIRRTQIRVMAAFAVHCLFIYAAFILWRMSPLLRRVRELDIVAGVVNVLVEALFLSLLFHNQRTRNDRS